MTMNKIAKTARSSSKISNEEAQKVLEKLRFTHQNESFRLHTQRMHATALLDDDENLTGIEIDGRIEDGHGRYKGNKEVLDIRFTRGGRSVVLDGLIMQGSSSGQYEKRKTKVSISPRELLQFLDVLSEGAAEKGLRLAEVFEKIRDY